MPRSCSEMYVQFTKSYLKETHKNFTVCDYFSKINANSLGNTDRERSPLSLGSDRTSLRVHTIQVGAQFAHLGPLRIPSPGRGSRKGRWITLDYFVEQPCFFGLPDSGDGLQTSMDQTGSHNQTDQFFRPLLNFSPLFRILKRNLFLFPHFVVAHILRVSFVWGLRIEVCPQANFTSFTLLSLETLFGDSEDLQEKL